MQAVPGYAHLHASKILHRDSKVAPLGLLYRDPCASAFEQHPAPGLKSGHLESLYRDRAST
jgi:hypothetical protein